MDCLYPSYDCYLTLSKEDPMPGQSVIIDADSAIELKVGGLSSDPVASVRCILWTSTIVFSCILAVASFFGMHFYSIEGVDILLLVFVIGAALNCLGMTIILVAEVKDVQRFGAAGRRQQPLSFWISGALDLIVSFLIIRILQTDGWKDFAETVFSWFSASEGPQTDIVKRAIVANVCLIVLLQGVGAVTDATIEVATDAMDAAEHHGAWAEPTRRPARFFGNEKEETASMV